MARPLKTWLLAACLAATYPVTAQNLRIDSITPSIVKADGSTDITILGSGFRSGVRAMSVIFGLTEASSLTVVDAQTIRMKAPKLPPFDLASGPRDVEIIDLITGDVAVLPDGITYLVPLGIREVSPREVSYLGKTPLTIRGQGFTPSTSAVVEGVTFEPASLRLLSSTAIELVAPPHAPSDSPIAVRLMDSAGGDVILENAFTYVGPLQVLAVAPNIVDVGSSQFLTVTGAGFTPETVFEVGGQRVSADGFAFGDGRTVVIQSPNLPAGEYEIVAIDAADAVEVRASLAQALKYVAREQGDPSYRLSFETPRAVNGETLVGVLLDELRNVKPGTSGYSLSIAVEGECQIAAGTTDGTVGAPISQGGLFSSGFQLTQIVADATRRGLVHALVFSLGIPTALEPLASPHRLLNVHVRPGSSGCDGCRIEFQDGLPSSFGPVLNAITYQEAAFAPELAPGVDIECANFQKPGDSNFDGKLDISDGLHLLGFLFLGLDFNLPCGNGNPSDASNLALLDSNGDKKVDISDPVLILSFLFLGGSPHVLGADCVQFPDCRQGPFCVE